MRYLLNSHLTMGEKWETGCGLTFKIWVKKLKDINISLLKLAFFFWGAGGSIVQQITPTQNLLKRNSGAFEQSPDLRAPKLDFQKMALGYHTAGNAPQHGAAPPARAALQPAEGNRHNADLQKLAMLLKERRVFFFVIAY